METRTPASRSSNLEKQMRLQPIHLPCISLAVRRYRMIATLDIAPTTVLLHPLLQLQLQLSTRPSVLSGVHRLSDRSAYVYLHWQPYH